MGTTDVLAGAIALIERGYCIGSPQMTLHGDATLPNHFHHVGSGPNRIDPQLGSEVVVRLRPRTRVGEADV
jgi:hypothetical protein